MPNRDGTGPLGIGPMTGRGNGLCRGNGKRKCNGNGMGLGFRNRQMRIQGQLQQDELTILKAQSQALNNRIAQLENK